ncbi:hypothetical protein [Pseudanabaena sp. ABRG5-3]|uniref:hypothetical protein n=1 Tax=Pseudanabaena sp. ABRG5-3 TaxID=685565 RepID=UPI000DC70599|nr:hypothetical protein [Pseudanabaena sp. ABRG5-3]BBC24773.1 hypothetical protein ABRG53_2516 [Pseudanabaena sp. ABRG5-3]
MSAKITVGKNQDQPLNPTGSNLQASSPFERRQNTLRQLHNREVREVFADVYDAPTDGTPYDPSKVTALDSPRRVLRTDCLIEDNDSFADMWVKAKILEYMKDPDAPVLLPNYDDIPISATGKPHVHLHFIEKKSTAILARRRRVDALISFRITEKTISSITQTDLSELRREINIAFPSTYRLEKGRNKYSYRDKENGFEFILSLVSETEAKEVITKVLAVRDKTPDWDRLTTSTSEKNFSITQTINILTVPEKLPKQRPIATCYLKTAYVTFGKFKKIPLISRSV